MPMQPMFFQKQYSIHPLKYAHDELLLFWGISPNELLASLEGLSIFIVVVVAFNFSWRRIMALNYDKVKISSCYGYVKIYIFNEAGGMLIFYKKSYTG